MLKWLLCFLCSLKYDVTLKIINISKFNDYLKSNTMLNWVRELLPFYLEFENKLRKRTNATIMVQHKCIAGSSNFFHQSHSHHGWINLSTSGWWWMLFVEVEQLFWVSHEFTPFRNKEGFIAFSIRTTHINIGDI